MDLQKQIRRLVGTTITFRTSDTAYEGVIHFVTRQIIMFQHAYTIPDRQYVENLTVSFKDIKSYNVVDCTKLANNTKEENSESQSVVNNLSEIDFCRTMEYDREEFILNLPPELASKLPNDYLVLNAINLEFHQAVDYIARQSTIGVSLDGAKISRSGHLSWISICTPLCIFLFDIKMLGQQAFDEGLRDIFQSKDIEKVMHDCRQPADCLTHLFDTDLSNVFDTQIADYVANMQMYGDKTFIKKVNSLDYCLINCLMVPREFIYNRKNYPSYELEINFFDRRPISNAYLNIAIKNTLYLLLLKQKLTELMLNPFQRAVDAYLKIFTNMCEAELVLESADSDQIAPHILTHNLQKIKYQDVPVEANANPFMCNFKHPQTGAMIELKNESRKNPNNFINNSLNDKDSEKCSMSRSQCFTTHNILSTVVKSPNISWETIKDSDNLDEIKQTLERRRTENVKRCLDKLSNKMLNSHTSENIIDVKLANGIFNSCGKNSDSTRNDANIETVQTNRVNSKVNCNLQRSCKFLCENVMDISEKSTTNVTDTLSKLHETPECLSNISENSLTSNKLCFVPSGMGC